MTADGREFCLSRIGEVMRAINIGPIRLAVFIVLLLLVVLAIWVVPKILAITENRLEAERQRSEAQIILAEAERLAAELRGQAIIESANADRAAAEVERIRREGLTRGSRFGNDSSAQTGQTRSNAYDCDDILALFTYDDDIIGNASAVSAINYHCILSAKIDIDDGMILPGVEFEHFIDRVNDDASLRNYRDRIVGRARHLNN